MGHEMVSPRTRLTGRVIAGAVAAVAVGAVPVANAVEIGEGITVTGFVDMSYSNVNFDPGPTVKGFGINQFETDFMFVGSDGVSAEVDVEYGESSAGDPDDDTTFVEQAFVTKKFNDMFSMKVGRFLSYTGWETEEPTGLFQYSGVGYAPDFYGYYQQGISAMYNGGMFSLMGSVVADAFDPLDRDFSDLGIEVGAAFMPIEGLTAKVFYTINKPNGSSDETKIINAWASYAMSGFTFAGEFNTADYAGGGDGDGFLVMGNYATGPWGFTARYGSSKVNGFKADSITVSPSYKVGKNLLIVGEYRIDNTDGVDADSFALEALFTF